MDLTFRFSSKNPNAIVAHFSSFFWARLCILYRNREVESLEHVDCPFVDCLSCVYLYRCCSGTVQLDCCVLGAPGLCCKSCQSFTSKCDGGLTSLQTKCSTQKLTAAECAPVNIQDCLCRNITLQREVFVCTQASCTLEEKFSRV
jgi:hypothetical protein